MDEMTGDCAVLAAQLQSVRTTLGVVEAMRVQEHKDALRAAEVVRDFFLNDGWDDEYDNLVSEIIEKDLFKALPLPARLRKFTVMLRCNAEVTVEAASPDDAVEIVFQSLDDTLHVGGEAFYAEWDAVRTTEA